MSAIVKEDVGIVAEKAVAKAMKNKQARADVKTCVWMVWENMGYAKDGVMTLNDFLEAPTYDHIRRLRHKWLTAPAKTVKPVAKKK